MRIKQIIKVVRGTDHTIMVELVDDEGNPYELQANEMLVFTMKRCYKDVNALIERKVYASAIDEDGLYEISIIPSDTIDLEPDRYSYDIGYLSSTGEFTMIAERSPFVIVANNSVRPEHGISSEFTLLLENNGDRYVTIYFMQSKPNGVEIDWGDGADVETTDSSTTGVSHIYGDSGEYTLTLTPKPGVSWSPGVYGSPSHSIVGSYSGNSDNVLKSFSMDGVSDPGSCSFLFCEGLETAVLSNGLKAIGWSCFNHCTSLESIEIPDSVELISENAFWNCTSLESITIPSGVKTIHKAAFMNCTNLITAKIKSSVLGDDIFRGCTRLQNVTLNDDIEVIPDDAFLDCTNINTIHLPKSTKEIESAAFRHCNNLVSVYIPKSLEKIGNSAFDGCGGLIHVYYEGTQAEWEEIDIWSGNSNLTSATIHYNSTW